MKTLLIQLSTLGLLTGSSFAASEATNDPRQGVVTYYGMGSTERAPDYGEVRISFSVGCQVSPEAVIDAIRQQSGRLWNTITTKISPDKNSESEKTYWGDISEIEAYDPTSVDFTTDVKLASRRDNCSRKQIDFASKQAHVYRGQQSIGFRSADLDWLESFVTAIKKIPQSDDPHSVRIEPGSINYGATKATQDSMKTDVDNQARDQATGANSFFELDRKSLNFREAHFVGRRPTVYVPASAEEFGEPVKSGSAPRVSLKVKIRYGFHVQTSDILQNSNSLASNNPQYEEEGQAETIADYAQTSVTVSSLCQPSQDLALQSIAPKFSKVLDLAKALQGGTKSEPTNNISYAEPSAYGYTPLQPVEYATDVHGNRLAVASYFDPCKSEIVSAESNRANPRIYFRASQTIDLKSNRFEALVHLTSELNRLNEISPRATDVKLQLSTPSGRIVEETRKNLLLKARERASKRLLDTGSSFTREANNSSRFGYQNAYLISIEIVQDRGVSKSARSGLSMSPMMAPGAAALQSEAMDIAVEARDNETRPKIKLKQTYAFDYRILTEDLLQKRNAEVNKN